MAGPLRVNIADGWYHVMHRGIERRTLFDGRCEHECFLELLGEVHERYRFRIHAYFLLFNRWHAIIQTPEANLSQAMQWLGLAYSSCQQTGGSDYAAVSMGLRRFEKRVKADRKLRSTYDQAKRMLNL